MLRCGADYLDLQSPQVMGVLNITPDSFFDGGSLFDSSKGIQRSNLLSRAMEMVANGASILDIGGESTRPGASPVSSQEEHDRVLPALEAVRSECAAIISVDTSNPALMREAIKGGAGMINDVRALQRKDALEAVASEDVAICLMHMQGEPETMQCAPSYSNVVQEVIAFLRQRAKVCLEKGIERSRLLLDPGVGFGKSISDNLVLLSKLSVLVKEGFPVLIGVSRKSLINGVLKRSIEHRLSGSLGLTALSVLQGASIIRTHDVRETADVVRMVWAVREAGNSFSKTN